LSIASTCQFSETPNEEHPGTGKTRPKKHSCQKSSFHAVFRQIKNMANFRISSKSISLNPRIGYHTSPTLSTYPLQQSPNEKTKLYNITNSAKYYS
jgi:uncharacterized membrane protein YgaE (UPF0421/DUF939 family)